MHQNISVSKTINMAKSERHRNLEIRQRIAARAAHGMAKISLSSRKHHESEISASSAMRVASAAKKSWMARKYQRKA